MASQQPPNLVGDVSLQPVNDLTRLAPAHGVPGFLDYETYITYLTTIGHVKNPPNNHPLPVAPSALNSSLQTPQAPPSTDVTSWRADQALWSIQHMPEILYTFERPRNWLTVTELREPPLKTYPIHGKILRDIPILPDNISNKVEGWRIEAWYRFDARIKLLDITDRIIEVHRDIGHTGIQMRNNRFRSACDILSWVTKGSRYDQTQADISQKLANAGVSLDLNTTRGISWGLVNVSQGEVGGRIEAPEKLTSRPAPIEDRPAHLAIVPSGLPGTQPASPSSNPFLASLPSSISSSYAASIPISRASTARRHMQKDNEGNSGESIRTLPSGRKRNFSEMSDNASAEDLYADDFEADPETISVLKKSLNPFATLDARSKTLNEEFGELNKQRRDAIPQSVVDSLRDPSIDEAAPSFPPRHFRRGGVFSTTSAITSTPSRNFKTPAPAYLTAPPPAAARVTVHYGNMTLTLRNEQERSSLTPEDREIIFNWHPSGSENRARQLEFTLDPLRAQFGFVDNNGYYRPIGGGSVYGDVTYNVSRDEATILDERRTQECLDDE